MKITDKIERKSVLFDKVKPGQVFMYDQRYFMAFNIIEADDGEEYNAINLESGKLETFDYQGDEVTLVNAELILT